MSILRQIHDTECAASGVMPRIGSQSRVVWFVAVAMRCSPLKLCCTGIMESRPCRGSLQNSSVRSLESDVLNSNIRSDAPQAPVYVKINSQKA